jgi:membrane protein YqaA with SNARE-associated domain
MAERNTRSLDEFLSSRATLTLAFAWGLAEATFFFIVPDVLLTLIACRKLKASLFATIAALAGALVGGALMFAFGLREPDSAHAFLDHIPAISSELITRVAGHINQNGALAVLLGPIKGIPYKIYAVEWGAQQRSFTSFMLISIPARYVRFFLATIAARGIARIIEPVTHHRSVIEVAILGVVWIAFYSFYFNRFGW